MSLITFFVSVVLALAVEERARQVPMKVHSYRPPASHDPETDLKTKREVSVHVFPFLLLHLINYIHAYFSIFNLSKITFSLPPLRLCPQIYAEQRRSSDNMSARSSDSDMSDVSALSRASSASRLSSTSYMSIQSERPRLRSVLINCWSHCSLNRKGAADFSQSVLF